MKNGLVVLALLSLCTELLPRPHGGRGYHGGSGIHRSGGRSFGGYYRGGHGHHPYRHGGIGFGVGLGSGLAVGLGYGGWRYGGWRNWGPGWWNTSPYWYTGTSWSSLSLERRLDAIERQIAILESEDEAGNPDALDQLNYLRKRRDQLARQL